MTKNRMEALSDGIFAIALTILVLEIHLPHDASVSIERVIFDAVPKVLSFGLSFIVIGMYWVAHHQLTAPLKHVNRSALWLNLVNLLFICFIPYPTALLGDYPGNPWAIGLYCVNLILVNTSGTAFWLQTNAMTENQGNVPPKVITRVALIHMAPVVIYLIAAVTAFFWPTGSFVLLVLVPLFFIIPNPVMNRILQVK